MQPAVRVLSISSVTVEGARANGFYQASTLAAGVPCEGPWRRAGFFLNLVMPWRS
jgi:hypothetical protein